MRFSSLPPLLATALVCSTVASAAPNSHKKKPYGMDLMSRPSFRGFGQILNKEAILERSLGQEPESREHDFQYTSEDLSGATETFVHHLHSFASGSMFDRVGFEAQFHSLSQQLSGLIHLAKKRPHSAAYADQVQFAGNLLGVMKVAAANLRRYSLSGVDQILVRNIITLNVRLLGLYDHHGIPDPSAKEYARKVSYFDRTLRFWGDLFSDLEEVPPHVWSMFKHERNTAENILQVLASHISNNEKLHVEA